MLNKEMHKTRLIQNTKAKHTSNAKTKTRKGEREKVTESLKAFFLPHLDEGEELNSFKFKRNMRALRRSPRGAKENGN